MYHLQEELRGVFDKMQEVMGTLNFVGLHVRVESDWDEYCRGEAFKVSTTVAFRMHNFGRTY